MANEPIIASKNYYRDAEGNLVDGADEKAAFLVAGKGTEISKADAEKYGITAESNAPEEGEEAKAAEAPENKAKASTTNKGAKK